MANSSISIITDKRGKKDLFGIRYIISDDYSEDIIKRLNAECDNEIYREHYKSITGVYPTENIIPFSVGRDHSVMFDNCDFETVHTIASKIAAIIAIIDTSVILQF